MIFQKECGTNKKLYFWKGAGVVKKRTNRKGFTLMEMLVVIAIIAVLIAIAIPVYTAQMHKVKIATDWANIRSYYAQIQIDYMTTEEYNPNIPWFCVNQGVDQSVFPGSQIFDYYTLHFLSGEEIKLEAGNYLVNFRAGKGYEIIYQCNDPDHYDSDEKLVLPVGSYS